MSAAAGNTVEDTDASADALLPLAADEIHLWLVDERSIRDAALLAHYHTLLNDEERRRHQRFHFARDRHQYLVTRALTRSVLSLYAAVAPEDWQFGTLEHGRPYILNAAARDLQFNLSHSHGLIVLAICRSKESGAGSAMVLGVDTENIIERAPPLEICPRYFSAQEVAELQSLPAHAQSARFFHYWTLKESYIKARGLGLSLPLDQFSFHFPAEDQVAIRFDARLTDAPEHWRFWLYQYQATHFIALCARRQARPQRILMRHCVPPDQTAEVAAEMLELLYRCAV